MLAQTPPTLVLLAPQEMGDSLTRAFHRMVRFGRWWWSGWHSGRCGIGCFCYVFFSSFNMECQLRSFRFLRSVGTDLDLTLPSPRTCFEDRNRFIDDLACWILMNLPTKISTDSYRHQLCSRFGTSNSVLPLTFEHSKANFFLDANKCK